MELNDSVELNSDDDDWGLRARGLQWSFCAHNYKIVTSQYKTIRLGLD